ncbi:hypothetical protein QQM41_11860 [Acetobacter sp. AC2005]|uniref:hypothetical protein n=1 Tax=Acetobacter sp. AC2005 TaxID=3134142 RepID=UPI0030CF9DF5
MNKIVFDPKTGKLTAKVNLQVTADYICDCGLTMELTIEWPENLTTTGKVRLTDKKCPRCHEPIVLPAATHYVEGHKLLSKKED